jgi:flagellar hook-length control protein FliK
MATILNLVPLDVKPNVSSQNISKKDSSVSDKSASGFAKVLSNQTDKNQKDDADAKDNTNTAQSILEMIGMVLPVATNVIANNQSNDKLANNVTTDNSRLQLVGTNLLGKTDNKLDLPTNKISSQNQSAALLAKMTAANTAVATNTVVSTNTAAIASASADSKKSNELTQAQLQELLQGKQVVGQAQVSDGSGKKADLTANNAIVGAVVSAISKDNSNGVGKNNNIIKPEDKKTATGAKVSLDTIQLIDKDEVNVKPVTAPQPIVNVVDAVTNDSKMTTLLGDKEQLKAENTLSDQTLKDQDPFASLLNQQVGKNAAQVSVSEAKQVAQQTLNDPHNIASQIVDQARLVTGQKNTEMIIQLKPEHLGELTLKVTVEGGVVSASFHSNNSEVRNVIEASLPQLKQDLSNQGLKIENVGVYAGLGDFFSNGQQRESQGKPEVKVQNKKTEEDFLEALESTSSIESSTDGSGVDYRV